MSDKSLDEIVDRLPRALAERRREVSGRPLEVAVVGAGMSGLTCARDLADHGHRVRVFDKARGVGGRMSTRRRGELRFDHGAQYFTARDPRFTRWVDSWRHDGLVAKWEGRVEVLGDDAGRGRREGPERFVGVPGMNAVCRHVAADLDVTCETRVGRLERAGARWRLSSTADRELGRFDAVVVSAPAPQTAELLAAAAPELSARAAEVEMTPCWAVMAAFDRPLDLGFDAAFVHGSPLRWAARNSSKPGRPRDEAWVLHASPDWSNRNLERPPEEVARELLAALGAAVGAPLESPALLEAHRWLFALPEPLADSCLFDAGLRLAACGDWCAGPRVEGAFLSGSAAAGRLLALRPGRAPPGGATRVPARSAR